MITLQMLWSSRTTVSILSSRPLPQSATSSLAHLPVRLQAQSCPPDPSWPAPATNKWSRHCIIITLEEITTCVATAPPLCNLLLVVPTFFWIIVSQDKMSNNITVKPQWCSYWFIRVSVKISKTRYITLENEPVTVW